MKFEIKVTIIGLFFSLICMGMFTYVSSFGQKTYYVYQVGIYKEEKNKNSKLNELKEDGYKGYSYKKDGQFYVLSMITENHDEIQKHSQKVKGIIKEYVVSQNMSTTQLLDELARGQSDD